MFGYNVNCGTNKDDNFTLTASGCTRSIIHIRGWYIRYSNLVRILYLLHHSLQLAIHLYIGCMLTGYDCPASFRTEYTPGKASLGE